MGADNEQKNSFFRLADALYRIVDGPVVWFRSKFLKVNLLLIYFCFYFWEYYKIILFIETIVEPNRQNYPWYHQKFRRVPTIDQCFTDDPICKFEANQQFKRDKYVLLLNFFF